MIEKQYMGTYKFLGMLEKIKKYARLVKQRRFDFILQAIAWSVPRWLFFYAHGVYVFSEKPTWDNHPLEYCTVRLATENDIELLKNIGMTETAIRARLTAGERAAIVIRDNEVKSAVWGGIGKRYLFYGGNEFDPGHDGVFYYAAYTKSAERSRGYYSAARMLLYNSFASDGFTKSWSVISANNPPWLAAVLKRNFRRMGETFFVKIFFVKICYFRKWFEPHKKIYIFFRLPKDLLHV